MESNMKCGESRVRAAPVWYEESAVDGVKVRASYMNPGDAEVTEEEALAYVRRGRASYPCGRVDQVHLIVDGDEVEIGYRLEPLGCDRIPRETMDSDSSGCANSSNCPKTKVWTEHVK